MVNRSCHRGDDRTRTCNLMLLLSRMLLFKQVIFRDMNLSMFGGPALEGEVKANI
jgi:hypothetical protein